GGDGGKNGGSPVIRSDAAFGSNQRPGVGGGPPTILSNAARFAGHSRESDGPGAANVKQSAVVAAFRRFERRWRDGRAAAPRPGIEGQSGARSARGVPRDVARRDAVDGSRGGRRD